MANPVQQHKQKWKAGDEYQEAIILNSTFRTNQQDHSTSFTYNFPEPLRKVTSMKLSAIEVPVDVYFSISDYYQNNKFYIEYSTGTNTTAIDTFTIPDGNYVSCHALCNQINAVLYERFTAMTAYNYLGVSEHETDSSCAIYASHNNYTITFHYDISGNITNLLDGNHVNIYFGDHSINNYVGSHGEVCDPNLFRTFGYIAGFRLTSYKLSYSSDADLNSFTGEAASNLSPTKSFLISVDDFNSNGIDNIKVAFHSSFLNKRVIARVPFIRTKDEHGTFLYNKYNDTPVNVRLYKGPTDITRIKVELLDDLGRRVQLQNTDWTFVLTITREA